MLVCTVWAVVFCKCHAHVVIKLSCYKIHCLKTCLLLWLFFYIYWVRKICIIYIYIHLFTFQAVRLLSVDTNSFTISRTLSFQINSWFHVTGDQGRIQEFILGGPNQGPQSKVKGEAPIEGAKRPSIEGEARVEGAKRPRIEGEARTEGEAREKSGGGVWGGGSVSPSPENFWKIKLETIHFGAYLKQLFEMTNEMV